MAERQEVKNSDGEVIGSMQVSDDGNTIDFILEANPVDYGDPEDGYDRDEPKGKPRG